MSERAAAGDGVQFFTMGDANYFPGAVALVNSLRLVGHHERIVFLDLGLAPDQRVALGAECDVVELEGPRRHPFSLQPFPHTIQPSGICVIIDTDVIVTQHLGELISAAASGAIAAFPDVFATRRKVEWESLFDLRAPLRDNVTYVNSGLVAFSVDIHRSFLARWWECCQRLELNAQAARRHHRDPVAFADQDALNALLMSEILPEEVQVLASPAVPLDTAALAHTRVLDIDQLVCEFEGERVAALHAVSPPPKPWTREARFELRRTAYVTCLRRLLVGPGLAINVDPRSLPIWLRSGPRGFAVRWLLHAVDLVGRAVKSARFRLAPRRGRINVAGVACAGYAIAEIAVSRSSEAANAVFGLVV